jgi:hypothetical protein
MTPPNNVTAERHLLGVLLRDALPFPPDLKPSDFFEPTHQDIVAAILSLQVDGAAADELTVSQRLRDMASPVAEATVSLLISDAGFNPYRPEHVDLIADAAVLRQASDIAARATDPDALLEHYARLANKRKGSKSKATLGPQRMDLDALLAADRKNDPNNVLGNRWLCKGGSLLIVGQSGTGKSSLMMQAAVHWATGRDFFGIKPVKPLRSVIIQAENDFTDVAESLQDVVQGAYLDSDERAMLSEQFVIYRDTTSTGTTFTNQLRELILRHQADIIYCDPLLSFAGIDVSAQEEVTKFLRHDLAPILLETGAVLVAMHHTGKPKNGDKDGQTVADLAYSGIGSSEFPNYFREIATLFRCQGEEPVYKFGLTKRRSRAGLRDADGQFKAEIHIRHARTPGVVRWEYSLPPSATPTDLTTQDGHSSPAKGSPRRLKVS